jgi:hypothetical protein
MACCGNRATRAKPTPLLPFLKPEHIEEAGEINRQVGEALLKKQVWNARASYMAASC